MRKRLWSFLIAIFLSLISEQICFAEDPPQGNQPLNATVSDFGTSFIFSPAPICSGCLETELGLLSLEDGRFLPAVITAAPFNSNTDFTVLINTLASESSNGHRTVHFGNRFDFVVRQQVLAKNGFVFTAAPHGTIFTRGADGGRIGGTMALQYGKGRDIGVANFTFTRVINMNGGNPKNDVLSAFDYYRMLGNKGFAAFAGFAQEAATGSPKTWGIEQGLVLLFKNGQMELAVEELNLNVKPVWQFQARVIVNWGKILRRK